MYLLGSQAYRNLIQTSFEILSCLPPIQVDFPPNLIRTVLLHLERIVYIYGLSYIILPLWLDTLRIYVGPLSEFTCWWYKFFKNFTTAAALLGFNFIILVRVSNKMVNNGQTNLNKKSQSKTKPVTNYFFEPAPLIGAYCGIKVSF